MTFDQIIENLDAAGVIDIARDIVKRRRIAIEDMWDAGHEPFRSHARQEFWAALKAIDPVVWSYPRVAKLSGHDHTSVMKGHRAHLIRSMKSMPRSEPAKTEAPAPAAEKNVA